MVVKNYLSILNQYFQYYVYLISKESILWIQLLKDNTLVVVFLNLYADCLVVLKLILGKSCKFKLLFKIAFEHAHVESIINISCFFLLFIVVVFIKIDSFPGYKIKHSYSFIYLFISYVL